MFRNGVGINDSKEGVQYCPKNSVLIFLRYPVGFPDIIYGHLCACKCVFASAPIIKSFPAGVWQETLQQGTAKNGGDALCHGQVRVSKNKNNCYNKYCKNNDQQYILYIRHGGVGVDKTITKTNSKTTNICSMPWTGRSKQEQKQNS